MVFGKSSGPPSSFSPLAAAASRFLFMSKRVTKAMSRIATSPPKTPLAIIAAGITFWGLLVGVAEQVGAEDVIAAPPDVFPLDVLPAELHRSSLLRAVESGVPDFVTVMRAGWGEEVVVVVMEDTLMAKMG